MKNIIWELRRRAGRRLIALGLRVALGKFKAPYSGLHGYRADGTKVHL